MMMSAILAPAILPVRCALGSRRIASQDELIVQVESRISTSFGFLGFPFLKDRSHVVIRVWFHAEGSAEDGSSKAENSSGEGLHAHSFAGSATFA